jgi:hypothetical protein
MAADVGNATLIVCFSMAQWHLQLTPAAGYAGAAILFAHKRMASGWASLRPLGNFNLPG